MKQSRGYRDEKKEEAKFLILQFPPLLPGDEDICDTVPMTEVELVLERLTLFTNGSGVEGDGNSNNN
jgi:hypothetical protein